MILGVSDIAPFASFVGAACSRHHSAETHSYWNRIKDSTVPGSIKNEPGDLLSMLTC